MSNPKRLQGLPFFVIGLAFLILGATSRSQRAFLGVGVAFLAIGASFAARARRSGPAE